jgi:hypothetical protein
MGRGWPNVTSGVGLRAKEMNLLLYKDANGWTLRRPRVPPLRCIEQHHTLNTIRFCRLLERYIRPWSEPPMGLLVYVARATILARRKRVGDLSAPRRLHCGPGAR